MKRDCIEWAATQDSFDAEPGRRLTCDRDCSPGVIRKRWRTTSLQIEGAGILILTSWISHYDHGDGRFALADAHPSFCTDLGGLVHHGHPARPRGRAAAA